MGSEQVQILQILTTGKSHRQIRPLFQFHIGQSGAAGQIQSSKLLGKHIGCNSRQICIGGIQFFCDTGYQRQTLQTHNMQPRQVQGAGICHDLPIGFTSLLLKRRAECNIGEVYSADCAIQIHRLTVNKIIGYRLGLVSLAMASAKEMSRVRCFSFICVFLPSSFYFHMPTKRCL